MFGKRLFSGVMTLVFCLPVLANNSTDPGKYSDLPGHKGLGDRQEPLAYSGDEEPGWVWTPYRVPHSEVAASGEIPGWANTSVDKNEGDVQEPGKNSDLPGHKGLGDRQEPLAYGEVEPGKYSDLPGSKGFGDRQEPVPSGLAVKQVKALMELYQADQVVRDVVLGTATLAAVASAFSAKGAVNGLKNGIRFAVKAVGGVVAGILVPSAAMASRAEAEIPGYTEDPEVLLGGEMTAEEVVWMMNQSESLLEKLQLWMAAAAEEACEPKDNGPFVKRFCIEAKS